MLHYRSIENIDFQQGYSVDTIGNRLINKGIYLRTIDTLLPKKGEIVLEINHKGADFLPHLFALENSIFYVGTENSKKSNLEAKYKNQSLYARGRADFVSADTENIPFEDESFDKILSVNDIYQWKNITETLKEVYRLLRIDGTFVLSFDNELLFQNGIFDLEEMIFDAGFSLKISQKIKEQGKNISILTLEK